jgi:AcrR family transcriptional regulator
MPTKAEQSEVTRGALMEAAERLFAEHGFADTSTEALVQAAGVTRGALYHHFRDKNALSEAVYEDLEKRLVARIQRKLDKVTDPFDMLLQGADAFLDCCLEPGVQRIVLLEGPTVLGWQKWREIDMRYGFGMVLNTLKLAMDAGAIRQAPVEALAQFMLGGLMEAAQLMVQSPNVAKARRDVGQVIRVIGQGLRA